MTEVEHLPGIARSEKAAQAGDDLELLEIRLLLEGIFQRYGFDFRDYAFASLRRRIWNCVRAEGLENISALQERVLHAPEYMERLLVHLSVHVTSMFRDPDYHVAFREKVAPALRTYPYVRLWLAGCSSGEEVYSMAILLREENLYEKCRIYATDISKVVLRKARDGVFPLQAMREYTQNYQKAGGKTEFSQYFTARYDNAVFDAALRRNVVFAQHNLVTDSSFNEFHVIMSRNVLIYFNEVLQARVQALFYESLGMFGALVLGAKESLMGTPHEACYERLVAEKNIYRRTK